MRLQQLEQLFTNNNIQCRLEQATETIPYEQLKILLPTDFAPTLLDIMFVPGLEDEIEDAQLLQFFVGFEIAVGQAKKAALLDLLAGINLYLPIPAFGYHETQDLLHFKHIQAVSKQDLKNDMKVILEVFYLISYVLDLYYPLIEAMLEGKITLEQAKASISKG